MRSQHRDGDGDGHAYDKAPHAGISGSDFLRLIITAGDYSERRIDGVVFDLIAHGEAL